MLSADEVDLMMAANNDGQTGIQLHSAPAFYYARSGHYFGLLQKWNSTNGNTIAIELLTSRVSPQAIYRSLQIVGLVSDRLRVIAGRHQVAPTVSNGVFLALQPDPGIRRRRKGPLFAVDKLHSAAG